MVARNVQRYKADDMAVPRLHSRSHSSQRHFPVTHGKSSELTCSNFWESATCCMAVDYLSRYPEVIQMSTTTSAAIIAALKSVFSRHGIPEVLRSDNGPQYAAQEFTNFAASYDFGHVTSSPYFPRSNGQVERTVQTVKRLLRQAEDPYKALLNYRATPLPWCGLSPVELYKGRHVRTSLPQTEEQLTPQWCYLPDFKRLNKKLKKRQKRNFDQRH